MTTPPEPNRGDILELYKLAVEMADRVSTRRGTANTFFLSVQTALVTLIGLSMPSRSYLPWGSLAVAIAGITMSAAWWLQLRSYRDLNKAKFAVISKVEQRLPVQLFTEEWQALRDEAQSRLRQRYTELGTIERLVPLLFVVAHLILFLAAVRA
ncbi:RipA family octameric membrane protein [Streptomyces griseoincarnatus]